MYILVSNKQNCKEALTLEEAVTRNVLCVVWSEQIVCGSKYSISQNICTRFCCALLCCGYAIVHNEFTSSIYPYSSGLLCWHWGIVRLPQCQWSKPDKYGKISQCITTAKHSKAKTVCIFLGIYCSLLFGFWERMTGPYRRAQMFTACLKCTDYMAFVRNPTTQTGFHCTIAGISHSSAGPVYL